MKIHYDLFELNGGIIFTIYEMAEKAIAPKRGGEVDGWSYQAKNEWWVCSYVYPEIDLANRKICLLGSQSWTSPRPSIFVVQPEDVHSSIIEHFTSESGSCSVQDIIQQIRDAIADWADNWPGWKINKKSSPHVTIIQSICL